jgi:dCMP deaminase
MNRASLDEAMMNVAAAMAARSTCVRRDVGCVLVNKRGHILSTGYNGVPAGQHHCKDTACPGSVSLSGTNLDNCYAVHAEQNALLQCHDVYDIDTCYVTCAPCITCTKLLMNTSCKRIVYIEDYPHENAKALAARAGIEVVSFTA